MFPSAAAVTINEHRAIKSKDKMMEPKSLNYKVYIIGKSIQKRRIVKKNPLFFSKGASFYVQYNQFWKE